MWGKKVEDRIDVGSWSGQVDLTRAVVTLSMLIGLGILWAGIAIFVIL